MASLTMGNRARGGYEPLESAGEYIVECVSTGSEIVPHVGSRHVREAIVRCTDCRYQRRDKRVPGGWKCELLHECDGRMGSDGYCAWGKRPVDYDEMRRRMLDEQSKGEDYDGEH